MDRMTYRNYIYNKNYENHNVKFDSVYDIIKKLLIEYELRGKNQEGDKTIAFYWFKRLCTLICSLSSDEQKLSYIDNEKYSSYFYNKIVNNKDFGEDLRAEIVASLESDEEKIKRLPEFKYTEGIIKIICSLSSDRKKIECYTRYKYNEILTSLSNEKIQRALCTCLNLSASEVIGTPENNIEDEAIKRKLDMYIQQYKSSSPSDFVEKVISLSKDEDKEYYINKLLENKDLASEMIYFYHGADGHKPFGDIKLYEVIAAIATSFESKELKYSYIRKLNKYSYGNFLNEKLKDSITIISSLGRTYEPKTYTDIITSLDQLDASIRDKLAEIAISRFNSKLEIINERKNKLVQEKEESDRKFEKRFTELDNDGTENRNALTNALNLLGMQDKDISSEPDR